MLSLEGDAVFVEVMSERSRLSCDHSQVMRYVAVKISGRQCRRTAPGTISSGHTLTHDPAVLERHAIRGGELQVGHAGRRLSRHRDRLAESLAPEFGQARESIANVAWQNVHMRVIQSGRTGPRHSRKTGSTPRFAAPCGNVPSATGVSPKTVRDAPSVSWPEPPGRPPPPLSPPSSCPSVRNQLYTIWLGFDPMAVRSKIMNIVRREDLNFHALHGSPPAAHMDPIFQGWFLHRIEQPAVVA